MSFGPTVTQLLSTDVTGASLVPMSKADARNEILVSEMLDGLLRNADAGDVLMLDATAAKLLIRQRGGVAGTDELRLWNDGTHSYVQFMQNGASIYIGQSEHEWRLTKYEIRSYNGLVSLHGEDGALWFGSGRDCGFQRAAAGVVASRSANTVEGWIQNTAGRRRITADATTISTTPTNLTDLSVSLSAGRHYTFKLVLFVEAATAADGLRVDFDGGTATMTDFRAEGYVVDSTSVVPLPGVTTLAGDMVDTNMNGAAMAEINGTLTVNAAGTFIPRIAKEADAAGATLTYRRGSYLWVEDTP